MKKALPIVAAIMLLAGIALIVQPSFLTFGSGVPTKAVIIRETDVTKPLPEEDVELFAAAEKLGVLVWDQHVLGKAKKPSAEAKPFLDAVGEQKLPVLALQWDGNKITVGPCPMKLDALKKAIGK
jgi:hypothetical protein